MTMMESLRHKLKVAMLAKDDHAKGMLRVVIGESDTIASRKKGVISDDEVKTVIKKMITNNKETVGQAGDRTELIAKLQAENTYLLTLLPGLVTGEQLLAEVTALTADIKAAKADGQATGLVNKTLRMKGLDFFGEEVNALVKSLRS